jgi:hypothetical protein
MVSEIACCYGISLVNHNYVRPHRREEQGGKRPRETKNAEFKNENDMKKEASTY